ncbi:unnamed protein product, partial [Urochloa humidicola]
SSFRAVGEDGAAGLHGGWGEATGRDGGRGERGVAVSSWGQ